MSETFQQLSFAAFAGLTVASAILVVVLRNLLHAAVSLFFCLSGVAALYIMLGADFLGVAQLLVYAGGILVLIIFGVFLTARIYEGTQLEAKDHKLSWVFGVAISVATFMVLWAVISAAPWPQGEPTHQPTTRALGHLLLTKYLLPFELISILLLFAMVGAAILVRKEIEGER